MLGPQIYAAAAAASLLPQERADQKVGLPPIHVRPASKQEPRAYLAEPAFSTCTVPVVYYQHHCTNFAHSFRGGPPIPLPAD